MHAPPPKKGIRALVLLAVLGGCQPEAGSGPCGLRGEPGPVASVDVHPEAVWTDEHHATVAMRPDGARMVAWDSGPEPTARIGLRRFDADLVPDPTLVLSDEPFDTPTRPDVVATDDGWWVVRNDARDVWATRHDLDGNVVAGPVRVNGTRGSDPYEGQPDAAAVDGGIVVVYHLASPEAAPTSRYFLRRVGDDLDLGVEVLLGTSPELGSPPDVAAVDGETVAVVWSTREAGAGEVQLGLFDADGTVGHGMGAIDTESVEPSRPNVAAGPDGLVVTWRSQGEDRVGEGAWARFFAPDGRPRGLPFALGVAVDQVNRPVVALAGPTVALAWEEPWAARVMARFHDLPTGEPLGPAVRLDPGRDALQQRSSIALRPVGRCGAELAAVWEAEVAPDGRRQVRMASLFLDR